MGNSGSKIHSLLKVRGLPVKTAQLAAEFLGFVLETNLRLPEEEIINLLT